MTTLVQSLPADPPSISLALGHALRAQAPALGAAVWAEARRLRPAIEGWDPGLVTEGPGSATAQLVAFADVLEGRRAAADFQQPERALRQARAFARAHVTLVDLLEIQQIAHRLWWDFAVGEMAARAADKAELVACMREVRGDAFACLGQIMAASAAAYEAEAEELRDSGEEARRQSVAALLGDGPVDRDLVAVRLGFELERHHLVVVAWSVDGETDPAERATVPALARVLAELADRLGCERPLVTTQGATAIAILSRRRPARAPELCEQLRRLDLALPPTVRLAAGSEAPGLGGLRASYQEATAARAFTELDPTAPALTAYRDVELPSLLAADPVRARTFVGRQLEGLAADTPTAERLRQTVAAYLVSGSNATRTAERLHVHKNTVLYRLRQAEQELGTALDARPLELACALQLARALPEVLTPPVS